MNKTRSARSNSRTLRRRILKGILLCTGISLTLFLLLLLLVRAGAFGRLPGPEELTRIRNPLASEIYSSDGVLMGKYYIHNRQYLVREDISGHLRDALIATEDVRFYHHSGIDFRSLGRVLIKSVFMGDRSAGGGSTLTQQLVKNLYPRVDHGILTLPVNKFREMMIARRIEKLYDKEEILELYFSTVPFGENTLGIKSASRTFFGKDPGDLAIEEGALLIGMLKATSSYHPLDHPEKALARRNVVLSQMARYGYISHTEADSLQQLVLTLNYHPMPHDAGIAPYFREFLRQRLGRWCKEYRDTDGTAYDLYTGGLKIHTTIDSRLQEYAESSVAGHMATLQELFERSWKGTDLLAGIPAGQLMINYDGEFSEEMREEPVRDMEVFTWNGPQQRNYNTLDSIRHYLQFLQAGFLAMEVTTGEIRAWVGGINYQYFKFDHVLARRQTGSVFKPLVYLAALEKGIYPCEFYPNDSVVYTDYDDWTPRNADRFYGGFYSLKGALAHSVNTVSVQLLMECGIDSVIDLGRRAGITAPLPPVPSLALGTGDISLLEMMGVYQAIANRGEAKEPVLITRIEDKDGRALYSTEPEGRSGRRICRPENADLMIEMLRNVVNYGTASGLRNQYNIRSDVAGKTGTTQNYTDGWFIGFSPSLVAGVWVGGDLQHIRFRSMGHGQGAFSAMPIWAGFMNRAMNDRHWSYLKNEQFDTGESAAEILDCDDFREKEPFLFRPLEELRELKFFQRLFRRKPGRERD